MKENIKNFYKFDEKMASATLQAHPIDINIDDIKLLQGDYSNVSFPIVFKQAYGKRLDDVIRTGYASLYMISDKLKTVLESNHLTGWQTFPVKILNKKMKEISGYHGLSITGRCGPVDWDKSEIIEKSFIAQGPLKKHYKGLQIGLDKWDGSDFFLPENRLSIIITSKAADILKNNKLTKNIVIENLMDIEIPLFIIERD